MAFFGRNLVTALLAVVALSAGEAMAGGIGFKNDLKFPIYVQGYSSFNGMKRLGPPILIKPGEIGWDNRLPNGTRYISIYDANQPNQPPRLREIGIPFQGYDLLFGVVYVPPGSAIRLVPMPLPK